MVLTALVSKHTLTFMRKRKNVRKQFVIDSETDATIRRLAMAGDGNQSRVVREGVRVLAEREAMLDAIEEDPEFIRMMEASERAIREGRVTSHEDVMRMSRELRRKRKSA